MSTDFSQIFIILGIAVNCGGNNQHKYLGAHNWYIGDAPFVGGIGGFASVFVTASFACGFPLLPLPSRPTDPLS
jgi:AAT family amino acid transporter